MNDASSTAEALPDYDIGEELGRGRFGLVLSGRHRELQRDVAIKVLPSRLAGDADAEVRRRFATDARLLASLHHPHIVPIYDIVERDGRCLLVMERLSGGTVWSRFQTEGVSAETACAVVMATCAGLHYAHERGVLHRDLKPENLLLSGDGVLKITDFGIAGLLGDPETLFTREGEVIGTPAFMAPEQAEGVDPTAATDIFAAGVLLFELLSGQLPYPDDGTKPAALRRRGGDEPLHLRDVAPDTPAPLVAATMRAIARSVDERYPSAEAMGIAVAAAATEAWGPEWLSRAALPIVGGGPIAEAAQRAENRSGTAPVSLQPVRPVASAHTTGTVPAPVDHTGLVPVRDITDAPPVAGVTDTPSVADVTDTPPVADVTDGDVTDGEVTEAPPISLGPALGGLGLLLLCLVLAIVGLGPPAREAKVLPGFVSVAGTDIATGDVVDLHLAQPLEIAISMLPAEAAEAEAVQLGFSVGGVPLPASGIGVFGRSDGRRTTSVEATSARFLAAGALTGEVKFLDVDGRVVMTSEFSGNPTGSPLPTIPGVVTIVLLLALLVLAAMRLFAGATLPEIGLIGAGIGVALVLLGWMIGAPEPRVRTFVLCAVLGGASGVATAVAARGGRFPAIRSRRPAEEAQPAP